MALYCVSISRDYLSDTPLLRDMGLLVSQLLRLNMSNWVRYPLPPFLRLSPLESMRSGGAIPPSQQGYLSDTCAIPLEKKANGCDTPSAIVSRKGYCAIWVGILHWAANPVQETTVTMAMFPLRWRHSAHHPQRNPAASPVFLVEIACRTDSAQSSSISKTKLIKGEGGKKLCKTERKLQR